MTEVFLAFRYLFRGKARHISFISVVACLGIMLGVATLIVVISVMNGFDRDLMEKLLRFNYHITVESIQKEVSPAIINKIERTEGVENVSVFLQTQIFGRFNSYIIPLMVRGIDFDNSFERNTFYRYVTEGNGKSGFFIGEGLARKFFLKDNLSFYPLERSLRLKEKKIRGVFKVGLYDIDNNYVICDFSEAKSLSNNYLVFIGVRVKDPFEVKMVKNKLKELTREGFVINTWIESNGALFSALKLEKVTMFIILSLIVVVASFNIFATLTVKVVEKTKDIGILKSLGFSSRHIVRIFSLQGIILGVIGVILGVGVGLFLCFLLKEYHFIHLPQEIYYIDYLPVMINIKDVILISLVGVFLSFFSSIFPAVRASSLNPSEALRYE